MANSNVLGTVALCGVGVVGWLYGTPLALDIRGLATRRAAKRLQMLQANPRIPRFLQRRSLTRPVTYRVFGVAAFSLGTVIFGLGLGQTENLPLGTLSGWLFLIGIAGFLVSVAVGSLLSVILD